MFTRSMIIGASPANHSHPRGALFHSRSVSQAPLWAGHGSNPHKHPERGC